MNRVLKRGSKFVREKPKIKTKPLEIAPIIKIRRSKSLPAVFPKKKAYSNVNEATNSFIQNTPFNKNKNNDLKTNLNKKIASNLKKIANFTNNFLKVLSKHKFRSWSSSPHKDRLNKRKLPNIIDLRNIQFSPKACEKKHNAKKNTTFFHEEEKLLTKMSSINSSAKSKASFVAFNNAKIHEHNHTYIPHLHSLKCNRFVSGFDKNR